eukprot:3966175-Prymnesium_polylepis.1
MFWAMAMARRSGWRESRLRSAKLARFFLCFFLRRSAAAWLFCSVTKLTHTSIAAEEVECGAAGSGPARDTRVTCTTPPRRRPKQGPISRPSPSRARRRSR